MWWNLTDEICTVTFFLIPVHNWQIYSAHKDYDWARSNACLVGSLLIWISSYLLFCSFDRYHPDKNVSNPEASELFKEVAYSYSILSDPEKRRQYDSAGFEVLSFPIFSHCFSIIHCVQCCLLCLCMLYRIKHCNICFKVHFLSVFLLCSGIGTIAVNLDFIMNFNSKGKKKSYC